MGTVYFFSSETSINNFSMLKGEFDSFFNPLGNHKFQPFNNRADFEQVLRQKQPGLFLMSSWHYARLPDKQGWKPVLVGVARGRGTQRHRLSARKSRSSPADLKGQTIAAAGSVEFTRELLREMLPAEQQGLVEEVRILTVPKDIDALLAVGFGVAAAAITTENGLERLARVNPPLHGQLHDLAAGPERLLPVIVAPLEADAGCEALKGVLTRMGADEGGRQRLRMLGLDAWEPVNESHLRMLGK